MSEYDADVYMVCPKHGPCIPFGKDKLCHLCVLQANAPDFPMPKREDLWTMSLDHIKAGR